MEMVRRLDAPRIAIGLALSSAIGGLAYQRGSLTKDGAIGAMLTGTTTLGFGGWSWGTTLITFFVSSSALSHYKEHVKEQRTGGKFAKGAQRDLAQVLANGGFGSALALVYGLSGEPPLLEALFVGVMGTVAADTWATELGVLSNEQPRLITTMQHVERGTSGAITMAGTGASAAGGLLMGLAMLLSKTVSQATSPSSPSLSSPSSPSHAWMVPAGLLGGLIGSLSDSLLSATVQATYCYPDGRETERPVGQDGMPHTHVRGIRWFNNDMVNLTSTLAGGLAAIGVFSLLKSGKAKKR